MALLFAAPSSKLRRPKAFAIRSFPPLCGRSSSSAAPPPPLPTNPILSPTSLTNPSPEPTSCGPGMDLLPHRTKPVKPSAAFAVRSFPKGCGPAIPKPRLSDEASASARGSSKEEIELEDDGVVGRSELGENDFEEELNEVVRRITEGGNRQGKVVKNDVVGRFLGERNGEKLVKKRLSENDGEKVVRKSLVEKDGEKVVRKSLDGFSKDGRRFSSPASLESTKKELSNAARRIPEGGSSSGKVMKKNVVGRSFDEKDGKKTGGKRSLVPDLVEGGSSQKSQVVEARHERLVVQALMAAKRCPWMLGKGKGSVGSQPRLKKLKS